MSKHRPSAHALRVTCLEPFDMELNHAFARFPTHFPIDTKTTCGANTVASFRAIKSTGFFGNGMEDIPRLLVSRYAIYVISVFPQIPPGNISNPIFAARVCLRRWNRDHVVNNDNPAIMMVTATLTLLAAIQAMKTI